MFDTVRVTPLLGGKTDGAVCSLLEIGGSRILLDCGGVVDFDYAGLLNIANELVSGGGIDAVVISHADMDHMGSLPIVFGRVGLGGVPVICTTPVSKFGKMILYDFCLNKGMEGTLNNASGAQQQFELDDVDLALSNVTTVKYSQTIHLPGVSQSAGSRRHVTLCAYPSGRTIGGSIWRIRHGATEVLYVMDINLRKEMVLDGVGLGLLPTSPALLIIEGGSVSRGVALGKQALKRGKKDDSVGLVSSVIDTLRDGGNVLIPCESAGRALEIMQILGKHWVENKLGMYHLVFLSHMAFNILEYAKSQLEWMSDSLSKGFYNGKPNPFELAPVRLVTSVRELERTYPGPKVVLATDSSLSCGLSKALLLRWGGDPRCRVIFVDASEARSLATELRGQTPPVLAMVRKPVKTLLVGEELEEHQREIEKAKRLREDNAQRKRREEELAALAVGRADDGENEDEDDEDDEGEEEEEEEVLLSGSGSTRPADSKPTAKRRKLQPSQIAKFVEPNFPMFETRETVYTTDDYGACNEDLKFQDITAATFSSRFSRVHPAIAATAALALAASTTPGIPAIRPKVSAPVEEVEPTQDSDAPWKLVGVKSKVQFTCGLKEVPVSGRADFKAIKTVISQLAPTRAIVLRGKESDCREVAAYAQSNGIQTFAPANGEAVEFSVQANRVRMQLPLSLLPPSVKSVLGQSGALSGSKERICQVCAISGRIVELADTGLDGIKIVRLLPPLVVLEEDSRDAGVMVGGEGDIIPEDTANIVPLAEDEEDIAEPLDKGKSRQSRPRGESVGYLEGEAEQEEEVDMSDKDEEEEGIVLEDLSVGVVSVGDVLLNNLKQLIEAAGVTVEFRLTASGGVLVCGSQVLVHKESDTDFVIEGPPVHAYWEARKALYQQYAFV